jgi:long-chain acyl-CoA synthetase
MGPIIGQNLADTMHRRIEASPHKTALLRKRHGVWTSVTWREYQARVFEIAHALQAQGLRPGDRVAILSQTRPEWAYCDFAVLSLGAVTVPIYPSVTADDVHFILKDSGARVIFVEDGVQRAKLESLVQQLPALEKVISFDSPSPEKGMGLSTWVSEQKKSLVNEQEAMAEWRTAARLIKADALASVQLRASSRPMPSQLLFTPQAPREFPKAPSSRTRTF